MIHLYDELTLKNLAQKNIMVANQNACLANLATLFYVSVVFSVGTFVGQKTYKAITNDNFLSSVDITGINEDISVKYICVVVSIQV